ncbi:MAG: cellulase family glycosylhydrolase [bacterium]
MLHVADARIRDEQDRTVLLRGPAVIGLGDYFQGNPEVPSSAGVSERDLDQIAALGMSAIRLLVHWSALEPARGTFSEAYLERVRRVVDWARARGLYVILDMHQDAWGKFVNTAPDEVCPEPFAPNQGWDGAPEWATLTDGKWRCRFQTRELSPAVMTAWESFWNDRDGIQQELVDTWAWLARSFRDDPTVAGYDLLNEPNWGLDYSYTVLSRKPAFQARALAAIRSAERPELRKIVFFEPTAVWSAVPTETPVPFTDDDSTVFAPHIYAESITADLAFFPEPVFLLRASFEEARREAATYGTTFWSGEWGWFGDPASSYTARYAALEDEFQVGGAWWSWRGACGDPHAVSWPSGAYGDFNGNLLLSRCKDPANLAGIEVGLVEPNARVLSRPYPRRFPGRITFTSDPATRRLDLRGESHAGEAPFEVWIPGDGEPALTLAGLAAEPLERVAGGWILRARPTADTITLVAVGSD